jgi:DNA-binding phage protein
MSTKIDPNAARRLGVRRFAAFEYLRDETDIAAYLEAAAAEEDPRILAAAHRDVARAREGFLVTALVTAAGFWRD